ncbi:MAG: hypothetical protein HYV33_00770 [Candidatus Kerfeldbacteria bacterium]|nr:hypothetical protein [Candidatus Kerfeldbacteria bacterium]
MERYIGAFLLGIMTMLGLTNSVFADSAATSFRFPLNNYSINDGCREWKWYGDYDGDGDSEYHLADDVCASAGTPVYAAANGIVKAALA